MIPLIQKDLDVFRESVWNTHRIRAQKDTILPDSIPNHMYSFPEQYGLEECGLYTTPNAISDLLFFLWFIYTTFQVSQWQRNSSRRQLLSLECWLFLMIFCNPKLEQNASVFYQIVKQLHPMNAGMHTFTWKVTSSGNCQYCRHYQYLRLLWAFNGTDRVYSF